MDAGALMRMWRAGEARFGTLAAVLAALGAGLGSGGAAAVTGICPDGSVYVARDGTPAPCRGAKVVESSEVPPLRPEYLPHPHTWRVYQEMQDPNNPYNLIDSVRQIRQLREQQDAAIAPGAAGASAGAPQGLAATAPGVGAGPPQSVGPLDLGLGDEEMRALYQLVELSQEMTPAAFERRTADGEGVFRVALARSLAFESRLADAWASRGGLGDGQVLVFTAVSMRPEPFEANLTFVQNHMTFQPTVDNPRQLGILQGHLGQLAADEVVLGYVILPDAIRAQEPMDVYWNDRRISVAFAQ